MWAKEYTRDVGTLREVVDDARVRLVRAKAALHLARESWVYHRPTWHAEIGGMNIEKIRLGPARVAFDDWQDAEGAYNHAAEWLERWASRLSQHPGDADRVVSEELCRRWISTPTASTGAP